MLITSLIIYVSKFNDPTITKESGGIMLLIIFVFAHLLCSSVAQQQYTGFAMLDCTNLDNSTLGYTCASSSSCSTFLTFRSNTNYTNPNLISSLLNTNATAISELYSLPNTSSSFQPGQLVLVPTTCSCYQGYYQHLAYYAGISSATNETDFSAANNTYQGLTTCQAMNKSNEESDYLDIEVPLRCACPTRNQTVRGIKYLLTYLITWGDALSTISKTFDAELISTLDANELSNNSVIFPFSTLLVPLKTEPLANSTMFSANAPPAVVPTDNAPSKKARVAKITGATMGSAGFIFILLLFVYYGRRKSCHSKESPKDFSDASKNIRTFLKEYGSISPKQYKYSALKKITASFSDKLGQGGYGSVYKGTLPNGRLVAVKILSDNKGNGDDFFNEIASIGRSSHVNIVNLLGFCLDGSKRALIYEYMCNGSLDKLILSEKAKPNIDWEKLYQIAVGIARGLEYLHRGSNTRIVHFDIKPHNILLDQDFRPKISDFGLSKLCLRKDSILSIEGTRGTAGYIAPEVFSRNFGAISSKSDIYSYGMMVLEMAGGKENIPLDTQDTSETYFPFSLYKHLEHSQGLQAYGATIETNELVRKMILIGLWCIQTLPHDRPSITKVIEMLEGSVEDLQVPPKPNISFPSLGPVADVSSIVSDGCSSSSIN